MRGSSPRGPMSGVWKMTTETSVYLIDLNEMTATRTGGEPLAPTDGPPSVTTSGAPLDGATTLIVVPRLRVGERAMLWLDVLGNGLVPSRITTVIRSLEPVRRTYRSAAPVGQGS